MQKQFQNELPATDNYRNQLIDKTIEKQSWVCPINVKESNSAFYNRSNDEITLPKIEQFESGKEFYYTALHEMAHSTGAEGRLSRKKGERFGDATYAKEELVAELSSAIVGRDLGLDVVPQQQNAAYMKSWLGAIENDPKYILSILQDVNKASNMIEEGIGLQAKMATMAYKEQPNTSLKGIDAIVSSYKEQGYESVAAAINEHYPNLQNFGIIDTEYTIKNVPIVDGGSKSLIGDIRLSKKDSGLQVNLENNKIYDKPIGKTEPLNHKNINLSEYKADEIKSLLKGGKVKMQSGPTLADIGKMMGLNKTPTGWAVSITKQIYQMADSSAGI
jgi:DNA-binding phage protein